MMHQASLAKLRGQMPKPPHSKGLQKLLQLRRYNTLFPAWEWPHQKQLLALSILLIEP